jgi:hypothetical protein
MMLGAGGGGGPNCHVSPMKMGHLGTCLPVGEARGHACTYLILRNENGRVSADPRDGPLQRYCAGKRVRGGRPVPLAPFAITFSATNKFNASAVS